MTFKRSRKLSVLAAGAVLGFGTWVTLAQEVVRPHPAPPEPGFGEANCTYFGPMRDRLMRTATSSARNEAALTSSISSQITYGSGAETEEAANGLPAPPGGSRTDTLQRPSNTIDKYIFDALAQQNVAVAPATNDYEFVRRIYIDLTGRIPTIQQVTNFVSDPAPDKRAKLIDTLIGSPNWVDKWVVWFGDLYNNNSRNSQIPRYITGVMAFNDYVRNSLTANKPYNQMAQEIIGATGGNSFTQGELNFNIGSVITNGPVQDTFDQQAADTFATFLGISHLNCLLCHNGRGHLDTLSLWGYYTTRSQAWGVASFFSHTAQSRTAVSNAVQGQPYYWSVSDNYIPRGSRTPLDYQLNTDTGNRPPRGATNSTATAKPAYIFTGAAPVTGESYRNALGRIITSDFQFARATVNYMWEYFFNLGLVSPSNQMDPYRLDPDNPPSNCPANVPCTLQASNPRLLNALAQDFIASGYDIRALQREIVNSRAYQLSSRYNGTWDFTKANLFGRKLVRRLWSEELHDSIVTSSGVIPTYTGNFAAIGSQSTWGPQSFAMRFPEPLNTPDGGGAVSQFLDSFLRGNRDDQDRRNDGSISQALDLMNDNFVMSRVRSTASGSLLSSVQVYPNDQAVNILFLTILSRPPNATELSTALASIGTSTRTTDLQNLAWALYNKVDFIFSY